MSSQLYDTTKRENEHYARLINAAWGARVAWVEDRSFLLPTGGAQVLPVIVSRTVNAMAEGMTPPPFKGRIERRAA